MMPVSNRALRMARFAGCRDRGRNLRPMTKKRTSRVDRHTAPLRFSPVHLIPVARRDEVLAMRRDQGYFLWTEEKFGALVRLRFLPSA